ncbi:hypothetical protein DFJ63DRAFT_336553 [Scheffersomyces coipomensis]|uniref:uncharacterized protein n=1 Tax=Scheffersomyces coipomensis TaxID=1788519 RepID=UPI00315DF614
MKVFMSSPWMVVTVLLHLLSLTTCDSDSGSNNLIGDEKQIVITNGGKDGARLKTMIIVPTLEKPKSLKCNDEIYKDTDWSSMGFGVTQDLYTKLADRIDVLDQEGQCDAWFYLLTTADIKLIEQTINVILNSGIGRKESQDSAYNNLRNAVEQLFEEKKNYVPDWEYMGIVEYPDPEIESLQCNDELYKDTDWSSMEFGVIEDYYIKLASRIDELDQDGQCDAWFYLLMSPNPELIEETINVISHNGIGRKESQDNSYNNLRTAVEQLIEEEKNYVSDWEYVGTVEFPDSGSEDQEPIFYIDEDEF